MTILRRMWLLLAFSIVIMIISYSQIGPDSAIWRPYGLNAAGKGQLTIQDNHQQYGHNKGGFSEASKESATQNQPMVASLNYWEQTGNALKNLFDLQCWARSVGIGKVVEPYIDSANNTVFHFLGGKKHPPSFKFQDLFNENYWNQVSSKLNHSILVSVKSFLRHASRKVIFVQLLYSKHSSFRCKSYTDLEQNEWFKLLEDHGFNISTVCIKILKSPVMEEALRNKIFGATQNSEHNATIIFEHWRGLSTTNKDRLELVGSRCMKKCPSFLIARELISAQPPKIKYPRFLLSPFAPLVSSKFVLDCLDRFLSEYMHKAEYVAVMLRSEKLKQSIVSSSPTHSFCMKRIMSDHKKALEHINGTKTLLFTDTGAHGSMSLSWKVVAKNFSQYLQDHLELELTVKELDSALEDITRSKDSVLMAMLESHLVSRATCVVIVGGGTFQALTMNMYANNHKGHECYYLINSECAHMYVYHPNIKEKN